MIISQNSSTFALTKKKGGKTIPEFTKDITNIVHPSAAQLQ